MCLILKLYFFPILVDEKKKNQSLVVETQL